MDKIGHYGRIIARQIEGATLVQIAREMGIARSTLYVWRDDPAYRLLESEMHRQVADASLSDVRALATSAVEVLRKALAGEFYDPADGRMQLAAAKFVLLYGSGKLEPADANMSDDDIDALAERVGWTRKPAEEQH